MNWFKRKYKKSAWFEGLLWAEGCKQRNSSNEDIRHSLNGAEMTWETTENGYEFRRCVFPITEFNLGACEYLKYYNDKLTERKDAM